MSKHRMEATTVPLVEVKGGAYGRCPSCGDQWITTGMELRVVPKRSYYAYPQLCAACGWRTPE